MSKVRDVVRARIKARIAAQREAAEADTGLGSVTLENPPAKTKAELQDELTAAGIEYPKNARKADLEALLPGNTTPDLGSVVAEDIEEEKP